MDTDTMSDFTIKVPSALADKDLVGFFRGWRWFEDPADEVVIDLSGCEFLAPWALTLFSAYALWLGEERGADVRVRIDPSTRAGRYAIQAGLLELLETPRPAGFAPTDETRTTPLTQIRTSREIPAFASSATALLRIDDEELADAVRYSIIELIRNVVQHSRSPIGGVAMAQYFPNTGMVEVAVADVGVGVLGALGARYAELNNHLSALKFSLLPHVSGTFGMGAYGSMQDNAGLGLFFIKEIAVRASGGFMLASGDSLVDLWGKADGSPGKKYVQSRSGGWQGTFAVLQLRRDDITSFESLLSVCRELAAQARRDPAEFEVDFVDEVPDVPGTVVVDVAKFDEDVDQAAVVRDTVIAGAMEQGQLVVLNFAGIRFATQSFVHALLYRILRDFPQTRAMLTIAAATNATKEAIWAVAAYARAGRDHPER